MNPPATAPESRPWQWPVLRLRPALVLLAVCITIGVMNGNAVLLGMRADGSQLPWIRPYVWELTGTLSVYLCLPIAAMAVLNAPRPGGQWRRFLAIHLGSLLLWSLLAPALFWSARAFIYAVAGWGSYTWGHRTFQLPMEWQKQVLVYVIVALGFAFYGHLKEARARAVREAELAAMLQQAQLQALTAQLDPHFLFNALNTVSAMMFKDLDRTDHLLASLGQMLRDGLEAGTPCWPLRRELAHMEAFLDFALARFGERLQVDAQVGEGLGEVQVPRFCLQRLLENALKHNSDEAGRHLTLHVRIGAANEGVLLEVQDNGRGFEDPTQTFEAQGIGLRNLRDVLSLHYGGTAWLEAANRPAGGASVKLWIPEGAHRD